MAFFATPYTIHFDDTMAYGSHHFLTAFKFQCASREALLYGELIFDRPGVRDALESVYLFTADAYSRNMNPAYLGDRVAIFITLEEWGRVSTRFCYRMLGEKAQPICAGFQTIICADAKTGRPTPLPEPLRIAFDDVREITEAKSSTSFRDRVLKGTDATKSLFGSEVCETALSYLSDRYPHPRIIAAMAEVNGTAGVAAIQQPVEAIANRTTSVVANPVDPVLANEVWVFPGQGAFDAVLLCDRIAECVRLMPELRIELDQCADIVVQELGADGHALLGGSVEKCVNAARANASLSQIAIFLQSVLGARLRQRRTVPAMLMGHSFGELAAFCIGGCFDMTTGVRIVCQRVAAVKEFGPESGGILVAATNRNIVGEEISVCRLSGLRIAGRNHERQTIVSGPIGQLDQLRQHLKSFDIESTSIPSPTSFHHPSLQTAANAWFRRLQQLPISAPSQAIYSPIVRKVITSDDNIAANLSSHFLRSFDLQGAIDDLVAGGTSTFVDCGSSGSLARLLKAAGPEGIQVLRVGEADDTLKCECSSTCEDASTRMGIASHPEVIVSGSYRQAEVKDAPRRTKRQRTSIAIVGQGCLLPGRATSPSELYSAIINGRTGIVDQRKRDPDWERDFYSAELTPDRSTSALAGRIDDRDIVPPDGIEPSVFAEFSRAQRVLCVSLAGCLPALRAADPKKVLCLVGATADGFYDQDRSAVLRFAGVDVSDPRVAERIGNERSSFQDPHIAIQEVFDRILSPGLDVQLIDAACASSLYSMALGMQALEEGEADFVLAGGVFCPGPGNNCLFSQFGGLTSTGCRPFDANADGVVFSEGAAFVALQRLPDAKCSSDSILAVVRGVGLSSDGRSSSANVPQTSGQILALERCYANYDVDPNSVAAIEAHGTSTPVGDATELKTLSTFFGEHVDSPIPVHSLKGLLGHSGWAAGAASVIAGCEVIRRRVFPPQAFYKESSEGLANASGVLSIPTEPTPIDLNGKCIAIDGFGFGGSNAHVVIEPFQPGAGGDETEVAFNDVVANTSRDDELVVVARHQLVPTLVEFDASGRKCTRFDRDANLLPDGMLLLPDLADDMDVSQKLAISIVGETLDQISEFGDALRPQTGVVIAYSGKTERAIEATTRILVPRLKRELEGLAAVDVAAQANDRSRPSGPYTLQCMMPNVSAGRAALQFNLNGPNFVVDSGSRSLESAFSAAGRLLRSGEDSGSKIIIVAAINANRWAVPGTDAASIKSEYAAGFAVTTRRFAEQLGMKVVGQLEPVVDGLPETSTTEEKVATLFRAFGHPNSSSVVAAAPQKPVANLAATSNETVDEFPVYTPIWVEAALGTPPENARPVTKEARCIIAKAEDSVVTELIETAPKFSLQQLLVLTGPDAETQARRVDRPNVIAVDLQNEESAMSAIRKIVAFSPDVVVALGLANSWDLSETLEDVSHNDLCDMLFLTIKNLASRIRSQETEVWGLFPGGWDEVVHPMTGAVSGLIKSVKREMPDGRLGVLSRRDNSIVDAFRGLLRERRSPDNCEQEIVHDGGRRLLRRFRPSDIATESSVSAGVRFSLNADSVVIASGGARGVTAVTIETLLADYGCTVVCLGRSPLKVGPADFESADVQQQYFADFVAEHPEASLHEMKKSYESALASWEANETIERLSSVGGRVQYMAVDVTDADAVESAVDRVAHEFGRVDLLIHGAGVQWSKRIESRTLAEFRKTFAVKVAGLSHLLGSCRSQFGRLVPAITYGSAYSIFGNDGQHDYGAANETMDRLCGLTRRSPDHAWSSIAWSAWDGIGMTRGSEYRALAERRNLALLDAEGGQRIFRSIVRGDVGSEINLPLSDAERSRYRLRTVPAAPHPSVLRTSETSVPLAGLRCLEYHRARGALTLPGAWIINYMTEAVLTHAGESADFVGVKDMRFLRFVRASNELDPNLRIIVDSTHDSYYVKLIGDILNPAGFALATDVVFASANLSIIRQSLGAPTIHQLSHNGEMRSVSDPYCVEGQVVELSGPFDCLSGIRIGSLGRQAVFAPDQSVDWPGVVPSLLLDASFRVACMRAADGLHVPTTIDRAVIPVGIAADSSVASGWRIHATRPNVIGDDIRCERIEITDNHGQVRMRAEGALVTRLWE